MKIFLPGRTQGEGMGGFLHLSNSLSGAGRLWSAVIFYVLLLCPCPRPIINVCQPHRPHCCLFPIGPPREDCNSTLQCYHLCRVLGQCRTVLGFFSVLPLPILSLLLGQICPPGSQCLMSLICVLRREPFVELWLPSL